MRVVQVRRRASQASSRDSAPDRRRRRQGPACPLAGSDGSVECEDFWRGTSRLLHFGAKASERPGGKSEGVAIDRRLPRTFDSDEDLVRQAREPLACPLDPTFLNADLTRTGVLRHLDAPVAYLDPCRSERSAHLDNPVFVQGILVGLRAGVDDHPFGRRGAAGGDSDGEHDNDDGQEERQVVARTQRREVRPCGRKALPWRRSGQATGAPLALTPEPLPGRRLSMVLIELRGLKLGLR